MFALWSSLNRTPIKSRCPLKKASHLRPIYLNARCYCLIQLYLVSIAIFVLHTLVWMKSPNQWWWKTYCLWEWDDVSPQFLTLIKGLGVCLYGIYNVFTSWNIETMPVGKKSLVVGIIFMFYWILFLKLIPKHIHRGKILCSLCSLGFPSFKATPIFQALESWWRIQSSKVVSTSISS